MRKENAENIILKEAETDKAQEKLYELIKRKIRRIQWKKKR